MNTPSKRRPKETQNITDSGLLDEKYLIAEESRPVTEKVIIPSPKDS
jgi:hypothetical protein